MSLYDIITYIVFIFHFSENARSTTEKMKEDFDEEEKLLKEEIGAYKKETASVLEEFKKVSFIYKGLKRGTCSVYK